MKQVLTIAICGLMAIGARAADQPQLLPGRSASNLTIRAAAGDRILRLGGHYQASAEGPSQPGLGLVLNGKPLDGFRLKGPAEITTPLLEKAYGSVYPRFHAATRAFIFKRDADGILNNGPWTAFFRPARYKTNHALPFIQLEVGDLLKEGNNILAVTNVNEAVFELTELRTAPAVEPLPDPLLPMPCWLVFSQSPGERARYKKALEAGLYQGEEKAELLAALGLHDFLDRDAKKEAAARWRLALAASPGFPSRSEILYRIVAERLETGTWLLPEADVRAVLNGRNAPDGWTELAGLTLATVDGVPFIGTQRVASAVEAAGPLTIDGVLDEPVWQAAKALPLQHVLGTNQVLEGWGEVRFAFDPERLAVAFTGRLPVSAAWTAGTNRDASVWKDNAVELVLSSDPQFRTYYELSASPGGGVYDGRHGWYWKTNPGWNGDWTASSRIVDGRFTTEYGIPWKTIGLDAPPRGKKRITATAIRVLVDTNENGEPVTTYLSATPHRYFDAHRLMDGLVLQFPERPEDHP